MAIAWTSVDTPPAMHEVREWSWHRCGPRRPCPICGKPDWCTFSSTGVACCMRVESDRPSSNGGWLHDGPVDHVLAMPCPKPRAFREDCPEIMRRWSERTPDGFVEEVGTILGLDPAALRALGIAWADVPRAIAFPMRLPTGETVGIRLREPKDSGAEKWAVTGSRSALFIPDGTIQSRAPRVYVCEGPTDTAALHGCGLAAIGRPSCTGQESLVRDAIVLMRPRPEVIVIADGDDAGAAGASRLAAYLIDTFPATKVMPPPAGIKDARAWIRAGGTRREIELRAVARGFFRRSNGR